MSRLDSAPGTLTTTTTEQAFTHRLAIYRAAVQAGFYTDWDGTTDALDPEPLAWLAAASDGAGSTEFPFTPDELDRLRRCAEAVQAGSYPDDRAAA
jgi:hypothetical protein